MEARRTPQQEMVDPKNRYILGTFTDATISYARMAIVEARELDIPQQEEAVLDLLLSTAGLGGKAREDLRDALAGKQQPIQAIQQGAPIAASGTGAQW